MTITPRQRLYLLIVGFVTVVILIAFALYFVFFRSAGTPPTNGNQNTNVGGLPNVNDILGNVNLPTNNANNANLPGVDTVAVGGNTITTVLTPDTEAQDPAADPTVQGNGVRYYEPGSGKFYRVDPNGAINQIGNAQFPGAENVTWSKTTDEVIVEFPDDTNIFYNLRTNRQVTLPKEFESFDFAPDGEQIAFKYMHSDPERRVLAVSSPDGSSARTLESLGNNAHRVNVTWSPTGKIAASYSEFIDSNRQEVGFVGLNNENFKGAVLEGLGLQYQYSTDGQRMLYSTYSASTDNRPQIGIVDADGENIGNSRRTLGVNTYAEKCAFNTDSSAVYCGVPTQQIAGYGLEPRLLAGVPDEIVRIDLQSGLHTRVALPVDAKGQSLYAVQSDSMVVTNNGQLMFQDQTTGKIVKIQLP